jgi:TPR repeat protein
MVHDYAISYEAARAAAHAGDPAARFRMGQLHGLGLGCDRSYAQAVRWYRLSARRGYPQAQCNLGFMYGTGRGVPQDYVQAYAWYNLAAAAGEDTARRNRDAVARCMSPGQLERAQELSREIFAQLESGGAASA